MKNMKKILVLAVAALLLVAVSVAGTVAYLTATTTPVINTFSPANIEIELEETKQSDGSALNNAPWKGQFVPGVDLTKDPKVTVTNDVDCYVFLKVTETNWDDDIATYSIDSQNWTQLTGYTDVWYKEVAASTKPTELNVITNQKITVSTEVESMFGMYETVNGVVTAKEVKLVFDAYACQKAPANDPVTAWTSYLKQPAAPSNGTTNP